MQLLIENEDEADAVKATPRLWHAVRTVAIADAVMSLDNVLAIAAIAKDSTALLILGLVISIPLIVAGSSFIIALLDRMPLLIWAGAALLGWIAGEMMASDPAAIDRFGAGTMHRLEVPTGIVSALVVLGIGFLLWRRNAPRQA